VSAAGLRAALSQPGGFGSAVRYFAAAGAGINAGLGLDGSGAVPGSTPVGNSQQQGGGSFVQNNTYQHGPEDPHIHAQLSRLEFQTQFG
jgi:hypothetical protein